MSEDDANGRAGKGDIGLRLRMRGEERRISSQHQRLDELCREVYARIDKDGAMPAIEDYALFMTALDAHMSVEEDIYFPALHGLRGDAGPELARLVGEHAELRADAAEIRDRLQANDREGARLCLDRLARRVSEHELAEEDLIARITEGPVPGTGHPGLEI
jgi:hemerythrin superfamily protein